MTSSDDIKAPAGCHLKSALAQPWTVPRFVRPAKFAIELIAYDLEKRLGGVPVELPPPCDLLKEAEDVLIEANGDIVKLTWRQRWAVPHFLWTSERDWWKSEKLIFDYLNWAGKDGKIAPRRLWGHYLLNMNPSLAITHRLANWLEERADSLTPPVRDFSTNWEFFKPERAIEKIAESLLVDSHLVNKLVDLRVEREKLLKSACLLCVFKTIGHYLRDYPHASSIPETIKQLINPAGNPIHQVRGHPGLGQAAQKALVEGLVLWASRQGSPAIEQTLDLLHSLIGDPRISGAHWNGIDSYVRQLVEQWLAKLTLGSFFQVMRDLRTDRDDMVIEREQFWNGYRDKIANAWLITGANGRHLAKNLLNTSFGEFADGAMPDHLGLVLQIKDYVVLEINKNGKTLFWRKNDPGMPTFFAKEWPLKSLRASCSARHEEGGDRFHMKHQPSHGWQDRYETEILRRTDVSRSG